MELVAIVTLLALLQYMYFGILVGKARGAHGIDAPACTGNETFERYYRVHVNTLEQLVVIVPVMALFAAHVRADVAAGLGAIYIIGRFIYLKGYVADPKKRSLGFVLSWLPSLIMIFWGLINLGMGMM